MMTQEEIEQARKRLVAIKKIIDSGERNKAYIELAEEVGAVGCPRDMPTVGERDAEHIRSIHQALQTATQALQAATMIEASSKKYDAKNYKIAIVIVIITALGVIAAWVAIFAK